MSREIKKILVIKLGALGDFVLALAAMRKIREAHPRAKITLLTTPPFEALAKLSPYVNAVETDGRPGDFQDLTRMLRRLRAARYDRVYDLQTNNRTNWYFQALRPFPPQWSGIAYGAGLPQRGSARLTMHTLERQADQLKAAGIWPDAPTEPGSAPPPDLSWILKVAKGVRAPAAGGKPYVLLVPGGSSHRPEKRWPLENFAQLAAVLKDRGLDVLIIGGPQESAMARHIQKALGGKARDLTGRTDFAQLALLGAKAALVVGNDTGPTHLLAAAGAPTIALFSEASDPALCGPRGHVTVITSHDLKALPVSTVASAAITLLH
ncbi:MAG: glycosyl transferase family 9 [Caulobacter sp.]|nr:glycosyl transferase family 9 [Caulobacter sp.]